MTTLLNRTDLLACLKQYGKNDLDSFAALFGFELRKGVKVTPIQGVINITGPTLRLSGTGHSVEKASAQFHRIIAHRRFKADEINLDEPEWYIKARPFEGNEATLKAPDGAAPPPQPALMPWPRLWPWLKLALGANGQSHKPDLPRLVDSVASGRILRHLPKIKRKTWAAQAQLILDFDASLLPFWTDFNGLHEHLADFRGQTGLEVLAFPDGDPAGRCWQDTPEGWRDIGRYRPPAADVPVLVLSDLGCNDTSGQRRLRWLRFGKQLARTAHRAVALLPCPPRCWDGELMQLFISAYWDRAVRPPRQLVRSFVYSAASKTGQGSSDGAERLLTLLACAVRVEPALLRAARLLFPAGEMDVSAEYAAWNHPDVHATNLGFYFAHEKVAGYRAGLQVAKDLSQQQKDRAARLMMDHHAHLSPVINHEEQLAQAGLFNIVPPGLSQAFAERLAKTLDESQGEIGRLSRQWLGRMGGRQHASLWNNESLAVAWVKAHVEDGSFSLPLPEGLSLEKLAWALKPKSIVSRRLYQQGQALVLSVAEAQGSLVGDVRQSSDYVQVETLNATGGIESSLLYHITQPIPLPPKQRLRIRTDLEELQLDILAMPGWASVIGRDAFGLYAELELNGIIQRFRWINPGTFLMGSPDSEPERWEGETQHEVTLTEGYWLADTACTQALWMAVMDKNPSKFRGDPNNPVENVSWDDVQMFIEQLNAMIPELGAKLPSEAQWEYACRAGTTTPFSFGDNITPEQVNYDGNYPYAGGAKGEYRKKTVAVKSLPVNPWGLYEMHGNVWEWCADRYRDYTAETAVNPVGHNRGYIRALRGGSWINLGRNARSADRYRYVPAYHLGNFGFRLALG